MNKKAGEMVSGGVSRKEPATYSFSREKVEIERHRISTTQGSFSLSYGGQAIITYSDDIKLTGEKNEKGEAQWNGYSDERIIEIAQRLYTDGDSRNRIAPLLHREVIDLLVQGEAVVLSSALFDELAGDMPSNIASVKNPRQVGLKDGWLVGTKEALRQVEPDHMAYHELNTLTETLKSRYPEAGLSFGYIGNCDIDPRKFDDRSWRIFSKVEGPQGKRSWGGCSTEQVPDMFKKAEAELETWVRRVVGIEPWPQSKRWIEKGGPGSGMGM